MDKEYNVDLTKSFDENLGARSAETEKIERFYQEHPELKPSEGPTDLKQSVDKNSGDLYKTCKKINEKNSLQEHNVTKKTKKLNINDAKKKLEVAVIGSSLVIVGTLGVILTKQAVDAVNRENEFRNATSYLNENVMNEVLLNSGFEISINEDETYVYNFSSADISRAKQYLINNYGFDRNTSELAIDLYFNYNDEIFVVRGSDNAYEFFVEEYGNKDNLNNLIYSPEHVFENMNQTAYVEQVNAIKNEREGVQGARS